MKYSIDRTKTVRR